MVVVPPTKSTMNNTSTNFSDNYEVKEELGKYVSSLVFLFSFFFLEAKIRHVVKNKFYAYVKNVHVFISR